MVAERNHGLIDTVLPEKVLAGLHKAANALSGSDCTADEVEGRLNFCTGAATSSSHNIQSQSGHLTNFGSILLCSGELMAAQSRLPRLAADKQVY